MSHESDIFLFGLTTTRMITNYFIVLNIRTADTMTLYQHHNRLQSDNQISPNVSLYLVIIIPKSLQNKIERSV